jgi:hypothetical protein
MNKAMPSSSLPEKYFILHAFARAKHGKPRQPGLFDDYPLS